MKFYREYQRVKENIHDHILYDSCIPYKFWKKYIKRYKGNFNLHEIQSLLDKQCFQTDFIFTKEIESFFEKKGIFSNICCKREDYSNKELFRKELILFSDINNKAVYKICKKLQKNGANNMLDYYMHLKSSHKYHFLGGPETVYIKLKDMESIECPICLEEKDHYPLVILDCSHTICYSCFSRFTNMDRIRGTLFNRIIYCSKGISCPVCRTKNPLHDIKPYNFYPEVPKNSLN